MAALSPAARVVLSNAAIARQVRQRVTAYALASWNGLPDYRDADIERFIAKVVPIVESGQKQTWQLTTAYLDALARLAGVPVPKTSAAVPTDLRGVALTEVYRRPAATVYSTLANGGSLTDAVRLGGERLNDLVATDLQLARVVGANARLADDKHCLGYERTLEGPDPCPLCVIASTQRYSRYDLSPIHPGCQCGVASIYKDNGPGQIINEARYDDITAKLDADGISDTHTGTYGKGGGNFRDLTAIRVREHGEYGPTLTWADQSFTGPSEFVTTVMGEKLPAADTDAYWVSSSGSVYKRV